MRGLGLFLGVLRRAAHGGVSPTPPVNVTAPVVSGVGYVGYTLSTTDGVWTGDPSPSFTYQWQRFVGGVWTDIAGATAATYDVTLDDEGVPVRCVVTATNIAGSASAASNAIEQWVPSDGGSVRTWYDAADASTITLATGIASWTSKGALAEALTQGTGANQPGYNLTGFAGRPCATFNGSTQFLGRDAAENVIRNAPGFTMATACRFTGADTTRVAYAVSTTTTSSTRATIGSVAPLSARVAYRRLDGDAFGQRLFGTITTDMNASLIGVANYAGGSVFGVLNGVIGSSSATGVGTTSDTASVRRRLGRGVVDDFFSGSIAEVLLYEVALDTSNLEKLAGYLHWRWQMVDTLDGASPYKTTPPTP